MRISADRTVRPSFDELQQTQDRKTLDLWRKSKNLSTLVAVFRIKYRSFRQFRLTSWMLTHLTRWQLRGISKLSTTEVRETLRAIRLREKKPPF